MKKATTETGRSKPKIVKNVYFLLLAPRRSVSYIHEICLPSQRVQTCSIGERSGDLAGHGRTSYLEDIVGRVAQYVDEHYPVDKWHLGDLISWVAQSALKYRPRICELSKCLEGPLKMIVCPKKLLPTLSHLVKLLYAARQ
ncbi:hypothetical protein TNCV_1696371 [Trichonephila clavipes]|nr:hypothetical protein TNCV_1696371 [Trichonephila clavipes]